MSATAIATPDPPSPRELRLEELAPGMAVWVRRRKSWAAAFVCGRSAPRPGGRTVDYPPRIRFEDESDPREYPHWRWPLMSRDPERNGADRPEE